MLAAYDATLLLAKSLLSYEPAFDAYISMRKSDVDTNLGLTMSAIGGAIGVATSITTVAAPWYLSAITSLMGGAALPATVVVSNPVGLALGCAVLIGTMVRKSQRDTTEELVTPEWLCK